MGKHDHLISYVGRPYKPEDVIDPNSLRRIAWMEDGFMKGAPYFEIMWYLAPRDPGPPTHTHTFDEVFGFIGSDPDHPEELNGIVKFFIEDEWYTFTKSVLFFVPAGMPHAPMIFEEIRKPIIHFSGGPNVSYSQD